MKKGNVTIKDIAQELKISVSTVSRALADNPLVKVSTREAVKELAEKYKYQPNYTALSLKNNQSKTLGVIIPQIVHEFFARVIRGIEDFAYSNGYNVIICSSHESYEREVIDCKALATGRVDGVLACISKETSDFGHFRKFEERNIPLVFFDCVCNEIQAPKVILDDYGAGYEATQHLIREGCKNIAYIGGPKNLLINKERHSGYQQALKDAGLKTKSSLSIHCKNGDFEEGKSLSKKLMATAEVDGFFATTDMLAIGVMKSIKKMKLKIPEDIAVVGFSNWTISKLYEPSLSTMSQPGYEMGLKAADLVLQQIKNPENTYSNTFTLKSRLIKRESSTRRLTKAAYKKPIMVLDEND